MILRRNSDKPSKFTGGDVQTIYTPVINDPTVVPASMRYGDNFKTTFNILPDYDVTVTQVKIGNSEYSLKARSGRLLARLLGRCRAYTSEYSVSGGLAGSPLEITVTPPSSVFVEATSIGGTLPVVFHLAWNVTAVRRLREYELGDHTLADEEIDIIPSSGDVEYRMEMDVQPLEESSTSTTKVHYCFSVAAASFAALLV